MRPCDTLTELEREVVDLVTLGLTNPQVALKIGTTEVMVKNYMKSIFDKTGMDTRLELALWRLGRKQ